MSNETLAVQDSKTELAPVNAFGAGLTLADTKDILEGIEDAEAGINLAPEYFEFEEVGQKCRGIFLGFTKFEAVDEKTSEVKILDSIAWMDKDGNTFSNAGVSLVGAAIRGNLKVCTPIEIEYLGEKKAKVGKMKRYALRELKPKN